MCLFSAHIDASSQNHNRTAQATNASTRTHLCNGTPTEGSCLGNVILLATSTSHLHKINSNQKSKIHQPHVVVNYYIRMWTEKWPGEASSTASWYIFQEYEMTTKLKCLKRDRQLIKTIDAVLRAPTKRRRPRNVSLLASGVYYLTVCAKKSC